MKHANRAAANRSGERVKKQEATQATLGAAGEGQFKNALRIVLTGLQSEMNRNLQGEDYKSRWLKLVEARDALQRICVVPEGLEVDDGGAIRASLKPDDRPVFLAMMEMENEVHSVLAVLRLLGRDLATWLDVEHNPGNSGYAWGIDELADRTGDSLQRKFYAAWAEYKKLVPS